MSSYICDTLIIGSGIAGLATAAKLAEKGQNVAIVTRERDPLECNSYYAQGGIIYAVDDEKLVDDIYRASSGTTYMKAAEIISELSSDILKELLIDKVDVDFERDENGELKLTREAAHSKARILYKGDYSGKAIQIAFLNYLKDKERFPNISILSGHTAIDLLTPSHRGVNLTQRYEEDKVVGAYLLNQLSGDVIKVISKFTVLATGGVAALYLHHSNTDGARGDGHAMAKRAGAQLMNMEFIQFHPTTYYSKADHKRFLITEAVRGEGGILKNSEGVAFMEKYHPDRELAPRDVVARAIAQETVLTGHDCVYLDISHKDKDWIKNRFPTIYQFALDRGVDMAREGIPVVPAAHYTCGGVKTDLVGKTSLDSLYAVGEVACTGLHGANRLASTALLEGLTFGYLAAEDIAKKANSTAIYDQGLIKDWESMSGSEADKSLVAQDWLTLRQTMWNYVGLARTTERLTRGQAMIRELYEEINKFYRNTTLDDELIGLRNGVEIGHDVINASFRNRDSVGCFYRKS